MARGAGFVELSSISGHEGSPDYIGATTDVSRVMEA